MNDEDRGREGTAVGCGYAVPIHPDQAPSDPAQSTAGPPPAARRRSSRAQFDVLAVIALGGMLGASVRYGLTRWLPAGQDELPWATFWTNLSGSFLLGLILVLLLERFPPTRLLRPFVATGILGAFTTMSTYVVEVALLIKDGQAATGLLYGLGSLVGGLILAYAGIRAGRLAPPRNRDVEVVKHVGRHNP